MDNVYEGVCFFLYSEKFQITGASLIAQLVKNLPAMQDTPIRFLGREDPLEKGKATHTRYSGLENSMDIHGIKKGQTQLRHFHF